MYILGFILGIAFMAIAATLGVLLVALLFKAAIAFFGGTVVFSILASIAILLILLIAVGAVLDN